jgi:hypothetical protein
MAIGEWQECLNTLERESQGLDDYVQRLFVEKDEARMTLHKVSSQVEYGRKLIEDAELKLADLQAELDSMRTSKVSVDFVVDLELHVPPLLDLHPLENDLEEMQRKVDAQKRIVQVFHETFGGEQSGAVERFKLSLADEAWANAKKRQELWMRHKSAYQLQLRGMKSGYERPSTNPSPLPSMYHDYASTDIGIHVVEIGVCPFCLHGFEPIWDCHIVSCRHAYHSWCALTHFSESTKCIEKNCGQDMHGDWWVSAGVTKPNVLHGYIVE